MYHLRLPSSSFSYGIQTRERAQCGRSVFPLKKKEKKKEDRGALFLLGRL